jgi:hypothetical protein
MNERITGLTESQVKKLQEEFGYNEISRKKPKTKLQIFFEIINVIIF